MSLTLEHIDINESYRKKWNITMNDFVCLFKDGKLLRNTLYRVGGLGTPDLKNDQYFMLIKHVEAFYTKDILKITKTKDPKHLEYKWCIIDKDGNEKVEFKQFDSPYLLKGSCVYTTKNSYFNVETGYLYASYCYKSIETENYILLDNSYDKDISKKGVIKIEKTTGNWELIN